MKKIKILLLILVVSFSFAMNSQNNVAHVYVGKIMENMPEVKKAEVELKDFIKVYDDQAKDINTTFAAKVQKYQQEETTTPAELNGIRMQEIQEDQIAIRDFENQAQQDIQKKRVDLMIPINEKILKAINTVAETLGLDYVFDVPSQGLVVYRGKDITEDVKKELGI